MSELFQLFILSFVFGLGLNGFVWLFGYLVTAAIHAVFK